MDRRLTLIHNYEPTRRSSRSRLAGASGYRGGGAYRKTLLFARPRNAEKPPVRAEVAVGKLDHARHAAILTGCARALSAFRSSSAVALCFRSPDLTFTEICSYVLLLLTENERALRLPHKSIKVALKGVEEGVWWGVGNTSSRVITER